MLGLGGESVMQTPVCAKSFLCAHTAPDCGMGPDSPSDSVGWKVDDNSLQFLTIFP